MRECTILVPTPPPSTTGSPLPRRRLDSTTTRPEGYRTCHVAEVRALRSLACPSHPHVGPLFRAWAFSSARGPAIPSLGLLIRTWARYSEPGQPRPRTEQRVNVRNRRPPYGSAGSHAGHVGVAITRGCSTNHWAAARPRRFNIHRSEVHATPKTPIFPRNKAEKSTPQQHVVSNNPDARQSATRPWLRSPPARHAPRPRTRTPASYTHHRYEAPTRAGIAKGPTSSRRWDPQCRWISSESDLRQTQRVIHLMILVTRPEPTVRPPSRMAKPRPGSIAIGWIS